MPRLNVSLSETSYRSLEETSAREGKSMAQLLREAFTLRAWLIEQRMQGAKVLLERDGTQRELARLF